MNNQHGPSRPNDNKCLKHFFEHFEFFANTFFHDNSIELEVRMLLKCSKSSNNLTQK